MNLLQYKSNEMVSSTELIRKSKNIFNKLQKKEIEKAVILRDGKPQFMLLDFDTYEELMTEYIALKDMLDNEKPKVKKKIEKKEEAITTDDELNKDELEEAFAQIEKLGLDETNISEVDIKIEDATDIEKQALKEFWE